jgi:hypothetical protein
LSGTAGRLLTAVLLITFAASPVAADLTILQKTTGTGVAKMAGDMTRTRLAGTKSGRCPRRSSISTPAR